MINKINVLVEDDKDDLMDNALAVSGPYLYIGRRTGEAKKDIKEWWKIYSNIYKKLGGKWTMVPNVGAVYVFPNREKYEMAKKEKKNERADREMLDKVYPEGGREDTMSSSYFAYNKKHGIK